MNVVVKQLESHCYPTVHGTVCHQHHGHRTCRRAPSTGHWRRTCSQPSGAIETFSWFWRRI